MTAKTGVFLNKDKSDEKGASVLCGMSFPEPVKNIRFFINLDKFKLKVKALLEGEVLSGADALIGTAYGDNEVKGENGQAKTSSKFKGKTAGKVVTDW